MSPNLNQGSLNYEFRWMAPDFLGSRSPFPDCAFPPAILLAKQWHMGRIFVRVERYAPNRGCMSPIGMRMPPKFELPWQSKPETSYCAAFAELPLEMASYEGFSGHELHWTNFVRGNSNFGLRMPSKSELPWQSRPEKSHCASFARFSFQTASNGGLGGLNFAGRTSSE